MLSFYQNHLPLKVVLERGVNFVSYFKRLAKKIEKSKYGFQSKFLFFKKKRTNVLSEKEEIGG